MQACEFYEPRESNDDSQAPPGPGDDTPESESDCQGFAILHREGWVKAERARMLSEILSLSLGAYLTLLRKVDRNMVTTMSGNVVYAQKWVPARVMS